MNDIEHALTLTDDLKVKIISLPNTDKVANDLTAKVEITLANGSQVIVDVPVNVIEKELQVAKNEASQQINQVTQQKLDEIDKDQSLTENKKNKQKRKFKNLKNRHLTTSISLQPLQMLRKSNKKIKMTFTILILNNLF